MLLSAWIVFALFGIGLGVGGFLLSVDNFRKRLVLLFLSFLFVLITAFTAFDISSLLNAGNTACIFSSLNYGWFGYVLFVLAFIDVLFILETFFFNMGGVQK